MGSLGFTDGVADDIDDNDFVVDAPLQCMMLFVLIVEAASASCWATVLPTVSSSGSDNFAAAFFNRAYSVCDTNKFTYKLALTM